MKFSTTVFSQTTYVTFQGVWVFEREVRRGRGERKERGKGMREEGPRLMGLWPCLLFSLLDSTHLRRLIFLKPIGFLQNSTFKRVNMKLGR